MKHANVSRFVALLICLLTFCAAGAEAAPRLRRALDRPLRPQPVYIMGGPTLGGAPEIGLLAPGFSGAFIFHPSVASNFLAPLFAANTGLVMHGEYRVIDDSRNLLTAEGVLRRYLKDLRRSTGGVAAFVGVGCGVALSTYPYTRTLTEDDGTTRTETGQSEIYHLSYLAELGYEIQTASSVRLVTKLQWRTSVERGVDFSNLTLHLQIGVPVPW